jgi:DNA-binding transcriptional ArsR family regulator
MDKKDLEDITKSLNNIEEKLDIMINLQKRGLPKPSLGKEEKKILQLCDKKHTIDDMAKATGKTQNNINVILSHLRDKGLIRSTEVKDAIVYEKI